MPTWTQPPTTWRCCTRCGEFTMTLLLFGTLVISIWDVVLRLNDGLFFSGVHSSEYSLKTSTTSNAAPILAAGNATNPPGALAAGNATNPPGALAATNGSSAGAPGAGIACSAGGLGAGQATTTTTTHAEVKVSNGSRVGVDQNVTEPGTRDERSENAGTEEEEEEDAGMRALVKFIVEGWEKKYTIPGSGEREAEVGDESGNGGKSGRGDSLSNGSRPSVEEQEREMIRRSLIDLRPPHVSDCELEEKRLLDFDRRKPDGSLPDWVAGKYSGNGGPHPPWVQGADEDNLPLTRIVQRDIWINQHPANCSDPSVRFAIAEWWGMGPHGIGSQLHGMTAFLGAAVTARRVLVPFPNYVRADQENCKGETRNRLACYFAPFTSPECSRRAFKLLEEGKRWRGQRRDMPSIRWRENYVHSVRNTPPTMWGSGAAAPWSQMRPNILLGDRLMVEGKVGWWRAQALRYMLRWPTKYMCGITNRVRNRSFGPTVAREMLGSISRLKNTRLYFRDARTRNKTGRNLEAESAKGEAEALGERLRGRAVMMAAPRTNLFVPRPLMSLHIRLAVQKMREMTLFGLPAYMMKAEEIRKRQGGVKDVWLSTEVESVIEQSRNYTAWNFFYSDQRRIQANQLDSANEFAAADGKNKTQKLLPSFDLVEKSFANLIISSEADYFLGALGSNWCRLIDELRKTNGRDSLMYVTVNHAQW